MFAVLQLAADERRPGFDPADGDGQGVAGEWDPPTGPVPEHADGCNQDRAVETLQDRGQPGDRSKDQKPDETRHEDVPAQPAPPRGLAEILALQVADLAVDLANRLTVGGADDGLEDYGAALLPPFHWAG